MGHLFNFSQIVAIHPLLYHYLSTKWGGGERLFEGVAYFKFWPRGGSLVQRALIGRFTLCCTRWFYMSVDETLHLTAKIESY